MNTVDVNGYLANVAQYARKCPTNTLRHAYVRALREWCQQTQWLRMMIPGATEANVQQYLLGNDPNLDIIGIASMQGSIQLSGAQSPQTWAITPPNDPGAWNPDFQPNMPLQYTYVPEAAFSLFPIPNKVYQLAVVVILTPKEDAVNVPQAPLQKYSNDIEAGALEYLFDLPGMPWSSPAMALKYGKLFKDGIANGKAEVQRGYNTGARRARPRAFIIGNGMGGFL